MDICIPAALCLVGPAPVCWTIQICLQSIEYLDHLGSWFQVLGFLSVHSSSSIPANSCLESSPLQNKFGNAICCFIFNAASSTDVFDSNARDKLVMAGLRIVFLKVLICGSWDCANLKPNLSLSLTKFHPKPFSLPVAGDASCHDIVTTLQSFFCFACRFCYPTMFPFL